MRSIVIVGASSGIGYEVARQYIEQGWRVGVASRNIEPLMTLKAIAPQRVFVEQIDVREVEAADKLLSLISMVGGVEVYLHSSGIGKQNPDLDPQIEIETLRTNGEGFVRMISAAFNYFKSNGGGHIAAITSVAGTRGGGNAPAYSAVKAMQSNYIGGLQQLSNGAKLGVTLTDVLPGFVATPLIGECPYPMVMTPQYVARKIIRAVAQKRRRVVIDWRYSLLITIWQLIPRCIWERMKVG